MYTLDAIPLFGFVASVDLSNSWWRLTYFTESLTFLTHSATGWIFVHLIHINQLGLMYWSTLLFNLWIFPALPYKVKHLLYLSDEVSTCSAEAVP